MNQQKNASQVTRQNHNPIAEQSHMEQPVVQPAVVANNTAKSNEARSKTLGEHNMEQLQHELSSGEYAQGVQNESAQNIPTNFVLDLNYVLKNQVKPVSYGDRNWKLAEIQFIQPTDRYKWNIWFLVDDVNLGLLTYATEVSTFALAKILFRVDYPITRGYANTADALGRKLFVKFENQSNGNGYHTELVDTRSLHFMPNF